MPASLANCISHQIQRPEKHQVKSLPSCNRKHTRPLTTILHRARYGLFDAREAFFPFVATSSYVERSAEWRQPCVYIREHSRVSHRVSRPGQDEDAVPPYVEAGRDSIHRYPPTHSQIWSKGSDTAPTRPSPQQTRDLLTRATTNIID